MADPLQSPKLKIERAKTIIQELDSRISDYTDSASLNLIRAPHPHTEGEDVLVAKIEDAIPDDIALIAGDAIHNIRTALDHLACCLAVANGKSANGVSFPFGDGREGFEARSEQKIKKLPPRRQKTDWQAQTLRWRE